MIVTRVLVYPVKGTRGLSVERAEVRPRGLAGDRRWMLVDAGGRFLQQRVRPELASITAHPLADGGLRISATDQPDLRVAPPLGEERRRVQVWRDRVDAADAGEEAAAWFSHVLQVPCRLVFMDTHARRPVPPDYGLDGAEVSFADTMPVLLATEASLEDLNRRMRDPVAMDRFRPNLVLDGDRPWEEDRWACLRIGGVPFTATHACTRCVVTTIDQRTGERRSDGEPLRTLGRFRKTEAGVLFGVNLAPQGIGSIAVGDPVIVERFSAA